jgi:hypothetical protein
MRYIECKAQWLSRDMTTKNSMSGFEGPAAKTEIDDGYGVPMMKGLITSSYTCWFEQTGSVGNNPVYDGTINIPDTPANRFKIAQHVRSRDLRVKDRNLEREILAKYPPDVKHKPSYIRQFVDMPEDFDGSKVVLRTGNMAVVDQDPIEDPYSQVAEGQFTEVPKTAPEATKPAEAEDTAVKLVAPAVSVAQAQLGQTAKQATEAPKGFDPKALKARAEAAKAAQAPATETPTTEAPKAQE